VLHTLHMLLFAAILSVFFALLAGREGRRARLCLVLFLSFAGGGVCVGLLMYALS
jgi:hypothetical protein